ncbi:MAG: hypothetical protein KatS3mg057_1573 [Herpetosiphonaceae bacterium]|nr:MAG: hypothetical protein KatS3mg057_1573 [Herpetosiphonaceae bacterium]
MIQTALPTAEIVYLEQLVGRLQSGLQQRLVGVYLFGSAAYGDYQPGQSDLDVQAVVASSLSEQERRELAGSLLHQALPCPARRLEFVCYARPCIDPASRPPQFELNLNTGAGETDHLAVDPSGESSHWFLLDIAIGRELGYRLFGPAPATVFAPIPRLWQLEAILDSLRWHREHEAASRNSILNACRGWRYAVTGHWGSKLAGAAWAMRQAGCPVVVEQAIKHQDDALQWTATEVNSLTEIVMEAVQAARLREYNNRSKSAGTSTNASE